MMRHALFEPLLTERQVLDKMCEIYGKEFAILSVESIEGGWKGKRFFVAPVDDLEVIITVEDQDVYKYFEWWNGEWSAKPLSCVRPGKSRYLLYFYTYRL